MVQILKETCVTIATMEQQWQDETEMRYARKRKIHYIDQLLDEFERLNLHDDGDVPAELRHEVIRLVNVGNHPILDRQDTPASISISEWMEALYDVQDTLMLPVEEEIEKVGAAARFRG